MFGGAGLRKGEAAEPGVGAAQGAQSPAKAESAERDHHVLIKLINNGSQFHQSKRGAQQPSIGESQPNISGLKIAPIRRLAQSQVRSSCTPGDILNRTLREKESRPYRIQKAEADSKENL